MPGAVIRATRGEVSERFPILGFTVRTGERPYFEVAIATAPELFDHAHRPERTPDTFWSSRTLGPLAAERGEAVFLIPDEVLRRFAGHDRIYYAIATYADRSRTIPEITRVPVEVAPFVSLSPNFGGHRTRQLVGARSGRQGANAGNGYDAGLTDSLEWAGDDAQPGAEQIGSSAPPSNGNGTTAGSAPASASALAYDDGFGADLWREDVSHEGGTQRGTRTRSLGATAFDVGWQDVPLIAEGSGLSCGAAAAAMIAAWRDAPAPPSNEVAQPSVAGSSAYHEEDPADIAAQFNLDSGTTQTYSVEQMRTLLESRGPLWIASAAGAAHAVVVTGMYGDATANGTYLRVNDPRSRLGSAYAADPNPTPGVGSQYVLTLEQFTAERTGPNGDASLRVLHVKPEHMRGRKPIVTSQAFALWQSISQQSRSGTPMTRTATLKTARARAQAAPALVPIASAIVGATMTRILNNEGDVEWELDQLRGLKMPGDEPARKGAETFKDATFDVAGWPVVESGLADQIYADFTVKYQFNGHSVGNIEIVEKHANDAVGWGLKVHANIMDDSTVYAGDVAAVRVVFTYRFTRSIGSDGLATRAYKLYADGRIDEDNKWTQMPEGWSSEEMGVPARAAVAGEIVKAVASPVINTILEMITVGLDDDITTDLPRLTGWKHVLDDPKNADRANAKTITTRITGPAVENLAGDEISADVLITWSYDGRSIGDVSVRADNKNDAIGWGLNVAGQLFNDPQTYWRKDGVSCAALRLLFNYEFVRTLGSPVIKNFDVKLFGNGAVDVENH